MAIDRTRGRRKGNYAGSVKTILPHGSWDAPSAKAHIQHITEVIPVTLRHNSLDPGQHGGIILLTTPPWHAGGGHGRATGQQEQGLAGARSAPSLARAGSRSPLPAQRVLRSPRPGAGQVRDAPPGVGRRDIGVPDRRSLRHVPCDPEPLLDSVAPGDKLKAKQK